MNRENFKEEFQKLICQFTTSAKDESDLWSTSLTKQEILDSVQEVLGSKLDTTLVDSTPDDVRTPTAGIITTTPDAPDIPKINIKQNCDIQERAQSFDSLVTELRTASSNSQLSLPNLDVLTPNIEENNNDFKVDVPDALFDERALKSDTNAASSKLVRSDTFVREDEFQSVKNGDVFEEKKLEPVGTELGSDSSVPATNLINIFMKLKALKDCANDLIVKIDDIQKVVPNNNNNNIRPIRRLSSMGCYPGLNRTSKMTRRSMGAFPGTPTSSRLSPGTPGTKDAAPARSKSRSTNSLVVNNNPGTKLSIPSTYRSVSSGALTLPKNMSLPPGSQSSNIKAPKTLGLRSPSTSLLNLSDKSVNRQTTNSKYSHVQSTIGKSTSALGKRKAN